jgi:hypothetical protein
MEGFVRAFLKASLAWLAAGVTLGLAMAVHPLWSLYRVVHMHMVLLGFVTMMIYGVGYHVLPRFAGRPLAWRGAGWWHWWASNVGLALMAIGFALRANASGVATLVLGLGGTLAAAGAYTFVVVMWRTIGGPVAVATALGRSPGPRSAAALPARDIARPG